jgi:uncharacterized protein (TIGR00369 family)
LSLAADPPDGFEQRVRDSFARQRLMSDLGARVTAVRPGEVEIELPFGERLTQQHGFLHGGLVATITDTACGYAALTLMRPGTAVLTVEYKINLLAPAQGECVVARGTVVRAGRRITVCRGDAYARDGGAERHVATMSATMIAVEDSGLSD